MGKGIELAHDLAPEHAALIDDIKDQLLLVFLRRQRRRERNVEREHSILGKLSIWSPYNPSLLPPIPPQSALMGPPLIQDP